MLILLSSQQSALTIALTGNVSMLVNGTPFGRLVKEVNNQDQIN
jgi:hypothetical protein